MPTLGFGLITTVWLRRVVWIEGAPVDADLVRDWCDLMAALLGLLWWAIRHGAE